MTHSISRRHNSIIMAAALAALGVLVCTHSVSAQYANGNGHANDANTRVGGGGLNSSSSVGTSASNFNYAGHNVTGGQSFSGPSSIFDDPRAFSGPTGPDPSATFARQSNAPVSTSGIPQSGTTAKGYYSDNRFAPPPVGSLPLGFSGGYVNDTPSTPASLSSGFNTDPNAGSLQARTNPQAYLLNQALNSPNSSAVVSQLQQNGQLNISPVYGLRTTDNSTGTFNSLTLPDISSADELSTRSMQLELRDSALGPNANNPNAINTKSPNGVQPSSDGTQQPPGLNDPLNTPLGQGFGAASNGPISSLISDSQLPSNRVSSTGIIANNVGELPSMIPPAEQQSELLATLQRKLEESGGVGKALVANTPVRSTQAKPNTPTAAGNSFTGTPNADQGPVPVSSLATGIKAKGLHDLLSGSEDLVRAGKFDSAIQKYEQALRVAPNNPLPILGRAQAELAGGYYAKADADLRSVFRSNPELLMMRFDLNTVLPKDRLAYLHKDLHDLAAADPKAERPWFVLAYLDYNTGDADTAEKDLNEAEQRSSHGDWSVRLLRQHWALPTKPAPAATPEPAAAPAPAPELTK